MKQINKSKVRTSKSNTIPQIAEAVIIDRNSKEHPQNEANQKELPKLKKHFTKNKECQGRIHLICCQAKPSSQLCIYVYIVCDIKPLENIFI